MTHLLEELTRRAQDLAVEERAQLAQELLESLDRDSQPDVREAWSEEIARRVDAYEGGNATLVPAAEVFAQARRITRT